VIKKLLNSRFVKDSAILQGSGAILAVLGALSTLVLAHVIGDELQGRYILATSVYALAFMLFNTGVTQAAVSQLGIAVAENRVERVAAWLAFLVKVYAAGGLFLLVVVGPFLPWLCEVLLDSRTIGQLGWLLCLIPLLDLPRVVAVAIFQAGRRMKDVARIEIAAEVARFVLVIGGALITRDATGPIVGLLGSTAVGSVFAALRFRTVSLGTGIKLPSVRRILGGVRDVPVRRGLGLGLRLGLLRSLDALSYDIVPPLMIKAAGHAAGFQNAEAWVSHFRIAQRLMRLPVVFMQGISRTALPALSHFVGKGDGPGFKRAFVRVTLGSTALVAVGVGVTTLIAPWLVQVAPAEYRENVVRLVRIMAIGYCAMGSMVAYDTFYILTERLKVAIAIIGTQCTVTFTAWWFICYHLPATGGGWGMVLTISWTLAHLVYITSYFARGLHVESFAKRRRSGDEPVGDAQGDDEPGEASPDEGRRGEEAHDARAGGASSGDASSGGTSAAGAGGDGPPPRRGLLARVRASRFARDAGLLQVSGVMVAGGAMLATVALSHFIGSEEQGRYFLALAGYGLVYMLLSMGVVQATVGQVAAARAREQWEKVAAWLAFSLKIQVLVGLVLFGIGYFTVRPLVTAITGDVEIAKWAWWLCLTPLFEAPKTMVTCALQGGRRMRALATMDVGIEMQRVLCVVGAVQIHPSARSAVLGALTASFLTVWWSLFVLRAEARRSDAYIPSVRGVFARVGDVPLLQGVPLSFRLGMMRAIDALGVNVLPPLILKGVAYYQGVPGANEWVAYMRIAQRIMQIPVILLQGLSRTALPSLTQLAGARDPERFRSLFFKISGLGGLLNAVGLACAYPVLLLAVHLFEPSYREPVAQLAAILAIGLALQGFAGGLDGFYLTANRLRVAILLAFAGLFVTMPALAYCVSVIPRTGIAWGLVATYAWATAHYVYVVIYFGRGTHLREMGGARPAPA